MLTARGVRILRECPALVRIKRAYEPPEKSDGMRILVDRVWPRGIKKEKLQTTLWMKEAAPSDELRKWFAHDPKKWEEFRKRYLKELERPEAREMLHEIARTAKKGTVTLVYSARDERHNQAVVLKQAIDAL
jgi:uncharacterized protein YeaO (DUF488 family)